jgi:spore maturation protein CgeB
LQSKFPTAYIGGGQRQQKLSPYEYARIVRESKICINFSGHPAGYHQVKGRVYEVLTCASLLLESKNPATSKIFRPHEHYVEFDNPDDLVSKVEYYSKNPAKALNIAAAGCAHLSVNYSSQKFGIRLWKGFRRKYETISFICY